MDTVLSAIYTTLLGEIKISYHDNFIVGVDFVGNNKTESAESLPCALTDETLKQLNEYFEGKRKEFTVPIKLLGTDFQIKVWQVLCKIPYGQTRSYKDIAVQIGNPKAARAVGMANNRNPIAIIVPCHRVITYDGKLGGYAAGVSIKQKLIEVENGCINL
ncbi:MAG: methylated-DNA--[protein]-cysteine S-methyltransferase [Lentimicrobiaceae bacterium]|nr:methylated-DNA--[protein]-cysteine S-methyltransferase [Lentimicrobiaceae bacterium]